MVSTRSVKKDPPAEDHIEEPAENSLSPRDLRRYRRENLRSKSTGVGISIVANHDLPLRSNRIVFGEDEADDGIEIDEGKVAETEEGGDGSEPKDSAESDDDDVVEEMGNSAAVSREKEEQEHERTAARSLRAQTKKRKRKKASTSEAVDAAGDDLDEEFFAKLDAEVAEEKVQKKIKVVLDEHKGRHTTFVVSGEEKRLASPIQAQHNIEVVVLKDSGLDPVEPSTAICFDEPSESAYTFTRRNIVDGSDPVSQKQLQKAKKDGRKTVDNTTWQRSKKMNRIFAPGAKAMRRKGKGVAAFHFVAK